MQSQKTTAVAHSNIAFIKYWGNRDAGRRIPLNDSLSMNLDHATTTTTVEFDEQLRADDITLGGKSASEMAAQRVVAQSPRRNARRVWNRKILFPPAPASLRARAGSRRSPSPPRVQQAWN
jgi:mevalonate pyrophosphate decarboxylase